MAIQSQLILRKFKLKILGLLDAILMARSTRSNRPSQILGVVIGSPDQVVPSQPRDYQANSVNRIFMYPLTSRISWIYRTRLIFRKLTLRIILTHKPAQARKPNQMDQSKQVEPTEAMWANRTGLDWFIPNRFNATRLIHVLTRLGGLTRLCLMEFDLTWFDGSNNANVIR